MRDLADSKMLWVLALIVGTAVGVQAQSESGTVAAITGTLQIQRGGAWQNGSIGAPVFTADRLRTGGSDQAKLVFHDDAVLDVAPNTDVVLVKQRFDAAAHRFESRLHLDKGKIRAWVSESYRGSRARYEVETPTAIASGRGTEFIVQHDAGAEVSDVTCVAGEVEVVGTLGVIGGSVQVGPQSHTQVAKGRFPSSPQRLDAAQLQQYVTGLDIVGTGHRDGLDIQHPAIAGRLLAPQDVPGPPPARAAAAVPAGVRVQGFQESLADRLFPDVRANTQPLLDFERGAPDRVPSGSVKVQF